MPQEKQGRSWSTEAELAFVRALGTHRPGAPCMPEEARRSDRWSALPSPRGASTGHRNYTPA
jgi:hypothetical protein